MHKNILITGGAGRFGRAAAEKLSGAGHRVFVSMREPTGRNRERANALWAQGIDVVAIDVTDDASVERGVRDTLEKAGRIDVLVNNASVAAIGLCDAYSTDQARLLFETNVVGTFRSSKAVLPAMRRVGDGLIVNMGSILGRVSLPFMGLVGASKFAIEGLSDVLRYEAAPFGIDVVLMQPSVDPIAMYESSQIPTARAPVEPDDKTAQFADAIFDQVLDRFKMRDGPEPGDIAVSLLGLIEIAKGSRPDRIVVGAPYGADTLNLVAREVRAKIWADLGLMESAPRDF
jgi:NAD(P)-dependent dehydrogenase (short-subunit alcohol dehydrogenase family)